MAINGLFLLLFSIKLGDKRSGVDLKCWVYILQKAVIRLKKKNNTKLIKKIWSNEQISTKSVHS